MGKESNWKRNNQTNAYSEPMFCFFRIDHFIVDNALIMDIKKKNQISELFLK